MTLIARASDPASPLPRFILRKRTVSNGGEEDLPPLALPTVNSAFLSGLFADVAQVSVTTASPSLSADSEADAEAENSPPSTTLEESTFVPRPLKKSRLSLHHSMSRCGRSFKNLKDMMISHEDESSSSVSPTGVADHFLSFSTTTNQAAVPLIPELSKHKKKIQSSQLTSSDSLHFQLCCVSEPSSQDHDGWSINSPHPTTTASPTSLSTVFQAGLLAFPHLPATVSNSSYSNTSRTSILTRNLSDLQSSLHETFNSFGDKEPAYGWFVVVDPDDDEDSTSPRNLRKSPTVVDPYSSTNDLAFLAPTAPLAKNQDEEVEWAKAADMVDDVLGDFF